MSRLRRPTRMRYARYNDDRLAYGMNLDSWPFRQRYGHNDTEDLMFPLKRAFKFAKRRTAFAFARACVAGSPCAREPMRVHTIANMRDHLLALQEIDIA